ncbi:hypothetical protein V8G54_024779 [Vigna mungo]|uniref:Uncharacterized protein n=1 Tax=Vigna mungo TaxID=3915 RepID=A0AAQ3N831_VIGMU
MSIEFEKSSQVCHGAWKIKWSIRKLKEQASRASHPAGLEKGDSLLVLDWSCTMSFYNLLFNWRNASRCHGLDSSSRIDREPATQGKKHVNEPIPFYEKLRDTRPTTKTPTLEVVQPSHGGSNFVGLLKTYGLQLLKETPCTRLAKQRTNIQHITGRGNSIASSNCLAARSSCNMEKRRGVSSNRHRENESFYTYCKENGIEYWERFKKLCASCPQLQMVDFILSFYEGFSPTDRSWADATREGSYLDKSPEDGIDLIERKVVDNQQYGIREYLVTLWKGVHEIENGVVDGKRIDERLLTEGQVYHIVSSNINGITHYRSSYETRKALSFV